MYKFGYILFIIILLFEKGVCKNTTNVTNVTTICTNNYGCCEAVLVEDIQCYVCTFDSQYIATYSLPSPANDKFCPNNGVITIASPGGNDLFANCIPCYGNYCQTYTSVISECVNTFDVYCVFINKTGDFSCPYSYFNNVV